MSYEEVLFFVKLGEICYEKTHSKFKRPLVPIIFTMLFEDIKINLINIQSTLNITPTVIYKCMTHFIYYISKIHMLLILLNKEVIIVATIIN